jgi:hypothetical protein
MAPGTAKHTPMVPKIIVWMSTEADELDLETVGVGLEFPLLEENILRELGILLRFHKICLMKMYVDETTMIIEKL